MINFEKSKSSKKQKDVVETRNETASEYHTVEARNLAEKGFEEEAKAYEKVCEFAEMIKQAGGQALLVGGSVRDEIIGMPCKDYDIEVYGIEPETLIKLANNFGDVKKAGVSFGVLKLQVGSVDLDVSLPRRETSTGAGHKDFSVAADPNMSIEEASRRRDFTFNAMCKDVLTGEIYDYFNGMQDLKERKLCAVDEKMFREDPLRVLRGVQFVGRFGLHVDDETSRIMRETRSELKHISKERFAEEWKKLLLRSRKPSLGLSAAMEIGIFHEIHHDAIERLPLTPQDQEHHPEGDVWTHTLMVVDEAAKIASQERLDEEDALILMLAAFCHDFGKPDTTKEIDGRITAHGHEPAGVDPAEKFLYEIGVAGSVREKVKKLVAEHLVPTTLYVNEVQRNQKITDGAFKRLIKRLYPATLKQLVLLAKADNLGRGPFVDPDFPEKSFMPTEYPAGEWLLERCQKVEGVDADIAEKPKPPISGRDLFALGFSQGPAMGNMIRLAEEMHVHGMTREKILSEIDMCIQSNKKESVQHPSLEEVVDTLKKKHSF